MYWIILLSAIVIICAISWLINKYTYSDSSAFFTGIGAFATLVLLVMLASLIDKKSDFRAIKMDYENTKILVENYHEKDYGNMEKLAGKVIEINETLAKHKAYSTSKWVGVWYSEEIGALEPLSLHK